MRLDSSGRLLVGRTASVLDNIGGVGYANIVQIEGAATGSGLSVSNTGGTGRININRKYSPSNGDDLGYLSFGAEVGSTVERARITCAAEFTNANARGGRLVFATCADGAQVPTERMRIDSAGDITATGSATFAGNVDVGAFDVSSATGTGVRAIASTGQFVIQKPASAGGNAFEIWAGTTRTVAIDELGTATFSGNITAGNVSDIKFKENITDAKLQLADVTALGSSLKNWDWKEEAPLNEDLKSRRFLGLIAQEAEEICPGLTYEVGEGEDSYKAINHDIIVMKLLGAVAELSAKVAALESA